jgi:hypothetical protein
MAVKEINATKLMNVFTVSSETRSQKNLDWRIPTDNTMKILEFARPFYIQARSNAPKRQAEPCYVPEGNLRH